MCVCVCVCVCIYQPRTGYDARSILSVVLRVWIQSFPSPWPVVIPWFKELSLPFCLYIAEERIVGCIPSLRVLARWEMQRASSRIWTRVAVSISYNSIYIYIYIYIRNKRGKTNRNIYLGLFIFWLFSTFFDIVRRKVFRRKGLFEKVY